MNNLLFLDVEATGTEKEDRLIQVAYRHNGKDVNELFKAPCPIKLPAMAVHHITEKMLDDRPTFATSQTKADLQRLSAEGAILVAHNAPYDLGMLAKEGVTFNRHICTLKIAKYINKDDRFENHQLQYLRYYFGVEVEAVAHDAFGDILVLEAVFAHLYEEFVKLEFSGQADPMLDGVLNRMAVISQQPSEVRRFTFGKYNGRSIADVCRSDRGYLEWLLEQKLQKPEGEDDWIFTLKKHLGK